MANDDDLSSVWEEVRATPLTTIIESLYPGAKKVRDSVGSMARGKATEAWKYTLSQGDHVKVAGPFFKFWNRPVSGSGGAINFYCELCGITPQESIDELIRDFHPGLSDLRGKMPSGGIKPREKIPTGPVLPEVPPEPKRDFKLPELSEKHLARAESFLIKDRGLDPTMVKALIDSRMAYPAVIWKKNKRPNARRPYYTFLNLVCPVTSFKTGKVIGVSNRSLTDNNKINEGDKQCGAFQLNPFGEDTKRVVLTESPIEALSYHQIHQPDPDTCVLGQSGTSIPDWFIYHAGKEKGCVIQSSLNNDIAGRLASAKTRRFCNDHGIQFEDKIPEKGEISMQLEPTEGNKRLIKKLIDISEKNQTSVHCEKLMTSKYGIRVENSTDACREIYKREDHEKVRVRDINRERRAKFREDYPRDPFPTDPNFLLKLPSLGAQYANSDWNDQINGMERTKFTSMERVFDVPEEFMGKQINITPELTKPAQLNAPSLKERGPSPEMDLD